MNIIMVMGKNDESAFEHEPTILRPAEAETSPFAAYLGVLPGKRSTSGCATFGDKIYGMKRTAKRLSSENGDRFKYWTDVHQPENKALKERDNSPTARPITTGKAITLTRSTTPAGGTCVCGKWRVVHSRNLPPPTTTNERRMSPATSKVT